jgi:CRISPR/Cas system-associated protein Csm6
LGEEIAMVLISMLAGASGIFLMSATPQSCAAQQNAVPVSITPQVQDTPKEGMKLPSGEAKDRSPAVLLPKCQAEPRKKRKRRLSDYPMA